MPPSSASEICPVSSDTTTATASLSSRQADGRAMPRPELAAHTRVDGQRQEAGGRGDAVLLEDDRAVVQRRAGLEDRHQQVVGQLRVERDAALDVVAQADLTLDRDDRARLLRRQHRGRDDDFLDRLVGRFLAVEIAEERRLAEVRQRAADVGLEDDDRRKRDVDQHVADHPVERLQRRQPRHVEETDDQQRARRHLDRASSPDQFEELVDQDRDDRDVEQVPPADRRAGANRLVRYSGIREVAYRSAMLGCEVLGSRMPAVYAGVRRLRAVRSDRRRGRRRSSRARRGRGRCARRAGCSR